MHGLETIIALNTRKAPVAAPRVPYVSYEYAAVKESAAPVYGVGEMVRCEADKATAWGVYGRYADGTAQHVADCLTAADADSAVALLNALRIEVAAAAPAAPAAAPPVHTFSTELHETLATLCGTPNLTAYERQLVAYAKIIAAHVPVAVRDGLAPVFPLEVR